MRSLKYLFVMIVSLLMSVMAFAQEVVTEPEISGLLADLVAAVGSWKEGGWILGLSAILTVVISSMKNSLLKELIWDKLKGFKIFVAPLLSLIIIVISVQPFTWKAFLLAMVTGAGAMALHAILDGVKELPFIGETWKKVIDVIGKLLGRKSAQ